MMKDCLKNNDVQVKDGADVNSVMRELYDIDLSDSTILKSKDKIPPIVREWQDCPLEEIDAVVFMDSIY